jgi:hypothetical protein
MVPSPSISAKPSTRFPAATTSACSTADEDIYPPLQGLDYWSRVSWHPGRDEFPRFGYFPERQLSRDKPLLYLVAPALHVHPATDILLRYISPEIEWEFVGMIVGMSWGLTSAGGKE